MSYFAANTGNPLGRRGLGRMGFDNAPYNVYPQPRSMTRLNGDLSQTAGGAISYRIDPRTGRYNFYRTDIKPRGVFLQNTFQHPAPDTVTALGARVLPIGKSVSGSTLQRSRTSGGPMIALRPGLTLSGLGCGSCDGRCNSKPRRLGMRGLRGLGAAECSFDTDCGPGGACAAGVCVTQEIPVIPANVSIPPFSPVPVPPDPTAQVVRQLQPIGLTQSISQAFPWLNGSSQIGNTVLPNASLILGGLFMAAMFVGGKKGR